MSNHTIGSNWDTREYIHVTEYGCAWVKYAAIALLVVAIRFLCCA